LLAAGVGLWGAPGHPEMHSHIAGVASTARGRDVGFALKLDQRAHALEHGAHEITWTFDPLVARNAHFNLRKLGGSAQDYLIDHYGPLSDGLNGTDETDRLLLRWDLLSETATAACDGSGWSGPSGLSPELVLGAEDERPVRHPVVGATSVLVTVPPGIEDLRRRRPDIAGEWRLAVRDVLGGLLAGGARLVDFDRTAGGYVLVRGDS
jgi:predicted GNAT superfamily acetyltransferase